MNDYPLHPLLLALLSEVPSTGQKWPPKERELWFRALGLCVSLIYDKDEEKTTDLNIYATTGR